MHSDGTVRGRVESSVLWTSLDWVASVELIVSFWWKFKSKMDSYPGRLAKGPAIGSVMTGLSLQSPAVAAGITVRYGHAVVLPEPVESFGLLQ